MGKFSDEFLISELHRFVEENGRSPTYNDMSPKNGYPSVVAYERAFSKWSNALKIANIDSILYPSKEYLLSELRRFYTEHGVNPTCNDMMRCSGYPTRTAYAREFGSFIIALELAGLTPRIIDHDFLISELKRFYNENNRIPRSNELFRDNGYPSISTYATYFGGLTNALEISGLISITNYDKDFLISEIRRFNAEYNKVPTAMDFKNNDNFPPFSEYVRQFDTWNVVIILAGFTPNRCDNIEYNENLYCAQCDESINKEAYWVDNNIVCKSCYYTNYSITHFDTIAKRRHKRRGFGYRPLNKKFDGSNGHHLHVENATDYVVYIPEFLHLLYRHNHDKEETMITPNAIAVDYWINEDFYNELYLGDGVIG